MSMYSADPPPPRNITAETAESVAALVDAQPAMYNMDAIYQPLRTLLNNRNLEYQLNGFSGGYLPVDPETGAFIGGLSQTTPSPTGNPAFTGTPETIRPTDGQRAPTGTTSGGTAPIAQQGTAPIPVPGAQTGTGTPTPTAQTSGIQATTQGEVNPQLNATYMGSGPVENGAPVGTRVTADDNADWVGFSNGFYEWTGNGWERFTPNPAGQGGFRSTGEILNQLPDGYTYEGLGTPSIPTEGQTGVNRAYVPAQRGLLEMLEEDIAPSLTRVETQSNTARREADINDVLTLGGDVRQAFEAANPEQAALMARLNELSLARLNSGLTDMETRDALQASRGAASARGFGLGPSDAVDEAVRLVVDNQARRDRNMGMGLQVAAANNAFSVDPLLALTGRASQGGAAAAAAGAGQFGNIPMNSLIPNPQNPYAADLYSTNYNGQAAANIASANNKTAIIGSTIEGVGGIIGGLAGLCWVARAAYGSGDYRWMQFRGWLVNEAPAWFRNLYQKHGEAFAARIADKPAAKRVVRWLMECVRRPYARRLERRYGGLVQAVLDARAAANQDA